MEQCVSDQYPIELGDNVKKIITPLLCFGRGEATSSRQDWLLLGKQVAKDILSPLPESEALVRI
jgi:hypothetical protein